MNPMLPNQIRALALLATALLTLAHLPTTKAADATETPKQPAASATKPAVEPLSLIVMDPLAAPLSCPCVEGYAQRKYEVLAEHLEKAVGRPVVLTFSESLSKALHKEGCTTAHVIIGKDSVVRADAKTHNFKVKPLAQLTGLDGKSTQTGLIVVRTDDPAQSVADLKDHRIIFGPSDCSEKSSAARKLLEDAGVELPPVDKVEISAACSDGACKIIEWGSDVRGAAVISSYAAPLLEGCGTIKKGDLRVVAESEPVPFITAFATEQVTKPERKAIRKLLHASGDEPELLKALESLLGFIPLEEDYPRDAKKSRRQASEAASTTPPATDSDDKKAAATWPGWRGPHRDGRAPSLPRQLAEKANILWRQPLSRSGLGGIAADEQYVILGDRDATNTFDVWRCYAAADGAELWTVQYPAPGKLDYDNMPRATPQIDGEFVYLSGAFGDLRCVDLATGAVLWETNIRTQFGANDELIWGSCASPLVVDGKVIVNPGAPEASIVALDAVTGEEVWRAAGEIHAFASPIVATLGGVRQIVAYDRYDLGGFEVATGRRLWTLTPPNDGDFNVPTPVAMDGKLLLVGENNGARMHAFNDTGKIIENPAAEYRTLRPDMSTPVAVGERVFCVWNELFCLDATRGLSPVWTGEDDAFADYAPIIASDERLLVLGRGGELLLIDAQADEFRIVSRLTVFDDPRERNAAPFAHPALVGSRLYLRGEFEVVCLDLAATATP
ncbi:MAG: PQQ-binding-like beta-propeller repeat protein [Pirellulales bacterium]|nr:PQQ-binding-like beta-propeller repeat protein [Pirellulales bacterium]